MPSPSPLTRRRFLLAGLTATVAACAGETDASSATSAGMPSPTATTPTPAAALPSPTPAVAASVAPRSIEEAVGTPKGLTFPTGIDPHRIKIAAINVDAPIIDLNITKDEVEVPEDFDDAGWWVQTRKPGEIGPSVIGGHVDSKRGPAVFFGLRKLNAGDEVIIEAADGETRSFVVDRVIQADKYDRPPEVFGFGENRPELRIVTCGGDFNPNIGHYVDNIIAFCHDPSYEA